MEGANLGRENGMRKEAKEIGSEYSPPKGWVLRFFGGVCPVTGKQYTRDGWKDKLTASFRR